MRTLFGTCSCVVASAALTLACGDSGGARLVGPTSLVAPTPTAEAAPTLDLSGSWRGTFNQSRDRRGYPPGSFRGGTMRLSLIQSGTQVSGTGNADRANSCMPSSFVVTGSVSGPSFSLNLTELRQRGAHGERLWSRDRRRTRRHVFQLAHGLPGVERRLLAQPGALDVRPTQCEASRSVSVGSPVSTMARKTRTTEPTRISSPSLSRVGSVRRRPSSRVPFLLPRSSRMAASSEIRINAWRRDTVDEFKGKTDCLVLPNRFSPSLSSTSSSLRVRDSRRYRAGRLLGAAVPSSASPQKA